MNFETILVAGVSWRRFMVKSDMNFNPIQSNTRYFENKCECRSRSEQRNKPVLSTYRQFGGFGKPAIFAAVLAGLPGNRDRR